MPRTLALHAWLNRQISPAPARIEPASEDASFRRYFRVTLENGDTRIVMDAPPEHEDCRPFLKVAALFREAGVHVPEVHVQDLAQGFLLLSDLGHTTYLDILNPQTAPALYRDANAALIAIQRTSRPDILPDYDRALLWRELRLFPDWYVEKHLGVMLDAGQKRALHDVFTALLDNALGQARVFVHRDWHSRNLMRSADAFPGNPGILDFQDAVYGPITYDLVSIYRDAYIAWDEKEERDFVIHYWREADDLPVGSDFDTFYRDYEWMGAQRQLKVLGIFARLWHRDGKEGYLKDMPRVMAALRRTATRYPALSPLARLLDDLENASGNGGIS